MRRRFCSPENLTFTVSNIESIKFGLKKIIPLLVLKVSLNNHVDFNLKDRCNEF